MLVLGTWGFQSCIDSLSPTAFFLLQAKETLEQQQPPEVRILKQLLRIKSPQERQTALFDAFEPAKGESTAEQDLLST